MKKSYVLITLSLVSLTGCNWYSSSVKDDDTNKSVDTMYHVEDMEDCEGKEGYLETAIDTELDFDMTDETVRSEYVPTFFDYDGWDFTGRDDQRDVCQREAAEVKAAWDYAREEGRDMKVYVTGRSCTQGRAAEEYKEQVGWKRAETVAAELERAGIPREAIEIATLGSKDSALAEGEDEVMHALMRRVDMEMKEA